MLKAICYAVFDKKWNASIVSILAFQCGAGDRTRTCTLSRWNLNPMSLPIPPRPRIVWYFTTPVAGLSRYCAGGEDGQAGGVDFIELAQGQGIFAGAHLNGEARAAVALDEPVLVPREAGCVGGVLQGVAA